MEPNTPDPEQQIKDADDRAEDAKASLMSRIDELGRRYNEVKHNLDLKAKIVEHPWPAIGIAFAAGALLALQGRKSGSVDAGTRSKRGLSGAIIAAVGAIAMRALKDVALQQIVGLARTWLHGTEDLADAEQAASRDPSVEAFLEH